jgi:hypothetical protein
MGSDGDFVVPRRDVRNGRSVRAPAGGIISKGFFAAGVAAVVLVLLGGTTWANDGFWAPDGAYALISQIIVVAWIAVLSGFLAMRRPSTAPERAAVRTA